MKENTLPAATIQKKVTCAFGLPAPKVLALVLAHPQKRPYAGRLIGIATGSKSGVSQYGDWTALIGSFQFVNPEGEIVRAVQAFGPDLVIQPVVAQLASGSQSVTVAVDVFAVPSEKSPAGWNYVCSAAIEETETDPLALLMAKTTARPGLLAAPVDTPAAAAKTAKKG